MAMIASWLLITVLVWIALLLWTLPERVAKASAVQRAAEEYQRQQHVRESERQRLALPDPQEDINKEMRWLSDLERDGYVRGMRDKHGAESRDAAFMRWCIISSWRLVRRKELVARYGPQAIARAAMEVIREPLPMYRHLWITGELHPDWVNDWQPLIAERYAAANAAEGGKK